MDRKDYDPPQPKAEPPRPGQFPGPDRTLRRLVITPTHPSAANDPPPRSDEGKKS